MDYSLENLLSNSNNKPLEVVVSEKDILKAELEATKLDNKLDAVFIQEDLAERNIKAIGLLVDKYENKEMSNETLDVLTTSLEAIAIANGYSSEHIIASVEDGKDSTINKMKVFIANLLKSFQLFYQKVMKYLTKWLAQIKVLIFNSDKTAKEIEDKIIKARDNKCKVTIKYSEASDGVKYVLNKLKLYQFKLTKLEDLKVLGNKVYDKAKARYDKFIKDEILSFEEVTLDQFNISGSSLTIFLKVSYKDEDMQDSKMALQVKIDEKDIDKSMLEYTIDFDKEFRDYKGLSLAVGLESKYAKNQIDAYFDEIKTVEDNLKKDLEEAKKKNLDPKRIMVIKNRAIKTIKTYRTKMSLVVKNNKLAISGLNTLLSKCDKEDNKEK
jgi:hypothetical protein